MTKEEVLRAIRNHSSEVKHCIVALDFAISSLVGGYRSEVGGEIDSLKGMMDRAKGKVDEIKGVLDEWPGQE